MTTTRSTLARKAGLALAAVSIVTMSACGSTALDSKTADAPGATASKSTTAAVSDPETPTTDLGGPTITGLGYTVQVHHGWTDGTKEFRTENPKLVTVDKMMLWGYTFKTSRANVLVETQGGEVTARDWMEALTYNDASAKITSHAVLESAIDGETATRLGISRTSKHGVPVEQHAYLVKHGKRTFSITASWKAGDDDVATLFDEILSTWAWAPAKKGA